MLVGIGGGTPNCKKCNVYYQYQPEHTERNYVYYINKHTQTLF